MLIFKIVAANKGMMAGGGCSGLVNSCVPVSNSPVGKVDQKTLYKISPYSGLELHRIYLKPKSAFEITFEMHIYHFKSWVKSII